MMKVADSILDLIGQTPLVKLNRMVKDTFAEVWVKLESFNPGGSVKDRTALNMIRTAEKDGSLRLGGTIVEPTSGNTGIGLAMAAAAGGYKLILCMPDTMSRERRSILQAYGAELILTPGAQGMQGAISKANELLEQNPDYFIPQQFENPANPEIHRKTTALEILKQTDCQLDVLVAGIGTGGTLTGVGEVIKQKLPHVEIIAVEPDNSPVLSGGIPGTHKIQGIGAGFVPQVLNTNIYDRIIRVKDSDALQTTRRLARSEGILAGISSGAAVYGALTAAQVLGKGKKVVAILPDTGERYLSVSGLFTD